MTTFTQKLRENKPAALALLVLPLALLMAGFSTFRMTERKESREQRHAFVQHENQQWGRFDQREGPPREERGDRRRGGRHHGPPPPPCVPPTVLFLVGAGLGYLIGRGRRGRCGPPPHHFRPDYYPPGHPAHQAPTAPNA